MRITAILLRYLMQPYLGTAERATASQQVLVGFYFSSIILSPITDYTDIVSRVTVICL